jgi:hypothetical protein
VSKAAGGRGRQRRRKGESASRSRAKQSGFLAWFRRHRVAAIVVAIATGLGAVSGAITKGADALRTVGVLQDKNFPVTRSTQVRACIAAHGLEKAQSAVWRKAPKQVGERTNLTRVFRVCDWPPAPGADADGYSEIRVRFALGPNQDSEWPLGPYAYRISSDNCKTFEVVLSVSGGTFERKHLPPVVVHSDEIKTAEDNLWRNDPNGSRLAFIQERGEADVLYNDHYSLDGITCK